jgi:hypothetical protein
MSFAKLIAKVEQAEQALEAQERRVAADWRQLKDSWRAGWTPARIVIAGLVGGFMVGRAEPLRRIGGGGTLQLISALAGLFAGGSAQVAAGEAEHAAETAETAVAANPAAAAPVSMHESADA